MKKNFVLSLLVVSIVFLCSYYARAGQDKQPLTVAEASDFTATSRYVDVVEFIRKMQEQSPLIRVETMLVSPEGREVPLVIIGNPVPSSPLDLRNDDRLVVYIQGNIHAGEVEGKEASLMLIRDILQQEKPPYLDKLVILFCPIFNADGNEKISPDNRRNQGGPEQGVGIRTNGQNLDLNRDSMKMESPELQGLIQNVLLRWDPVILVDCHTTNGSYHEEPVTYSWPLNPNGSTAILTYMRDTMMPALQKHLKDKYDTLGIPYGNFMGREMNGWRTFGHQPRYVTNYMGLRNRMAILIENYAHADFKTRVYGNYHYVRSILDYCHDQRDKVRALIRDADLATVKRGMGPLEQDTFAVEFEVKPLKDPVTILGYEMEIEEREGARPRMRRTDKTKTYTIPYHADFQPKRSVPYPAAYLIELQVPKVLEKLKQHGIVVERLLQPVSLEVESFQVTEIKGAERLYQGHRMNTVTGEYKTESREFGAGTLVVRTAQPLASLASYLLEPESDDGLLVWNYFDRYLVPQWSRAPQTYPVHKLYSLQPLVTEIIR
jgi:hypothetical protein